MQPKQTNPSKEEYQKLVNKALIEHKRLDQFQMYFRSKAKAYYLYEKLLGRPILPTTSSTELKWFMWCLEHNVDPDIKLK